MNADTFTNYLRAQAGRQDAIGDFARDWINDRHTGRPRGRFGWRAVVAHLRESGACVEAIVVARMAWCEWTGTGATSALSALPVMLVAHGIVEKSAVFDSDGRETPPVRSLMADVLRVLAASEVDRLDRAER